MIPVELETTRAPSLAVTALPSFPSMVRKRQSSELLAIWMMGSFDRDGEKLKDAKSVINKRFIHGPREKKECFPCPVFPYKLRATNYILKECAKRSKKKLERDLVKEFAIEHSIVKKGYHGGEFKVSK